MWYCVPGDTQVGGVAGQVADWWQADTFEGYAIAKGARCEVPSPNFFFGWRETSTLVPGKTTKCELLSKFGLT